MDINKKRVLLFFGIAPLIFFSSTAKAKWFTNSYLQMNLPKDWNCTFKKPEWVCQHQSKQKSREATIIMTANVAGPEDNLKSYSNYLSNPISPRGGRAPKSKIIGVGKIKLNGHHWIDGFHNGSEIKNWNTRYLATVERNLAVLVSFSNHTSRNKYYNHLFARMIGSLSLRVSRKTDTTIQKVARPQKTVAITAPKEIMIEETHEESQALLSPKNQKYALIGLAALVGLIGLVALTKKR